MRNIRQGNIEIRKTKYSKYPYEFIKWFPNEYFGKEEVYIQNGWVLSPGGEFLKKGNYSIDINFFRGRLESCYVVAWFIKGKEDWYLETVGARLLELSEEERKYFFDVYRVANKRLNK